MKKRILTITAAATLAIAASLTIAAPVERPIKAVSATDYSVSEADSYTKVVRLTDLDLDQKAESIDYQTTYPYVLMSYFAEMHQVSSNKAAKQEALNQRLNLLEKAGFSMVKEAVFIPESIQSLFVAADTPKEIATKLGLTAGFYDASSQFKARLFLNPAQKKVVIAIAGTNFSSMTSMRSAYSLGYGEVSQAAKIARRTAIELQKLYPGFTIELTGASQGGAVAQYAAATPQIKGRAIVFNSLGLHPSITSGWSQEQLQRISHVYLDGELLNGDSYSSYAARRAIQNKVPVDGVAIPVDPVLESYIADAYYKAFKVWQKPGYYAMPRSAMLHWTGSLLKAFEYHADYNDLPGLY